MPALQRGCEIIKLVATEPGISVSQIEKKLKIPKASLNRIIRVLADEDFICQQSGERGLKIGNKLLCKALLSYESDPLVKNTAAMLQSLGEKWKSTFVVYQYEEPFRIIWRAKYEPAAGVKTVPAGFSTLMMHISAQGQLFLSMFPDSKTKEFVKKGFAERFTEKTLTAEAKLLSRIAEIRKRKWAYQEGENNIARRQIAVPLEMGGIPGLYALGCHLPLEFTEIEELKNDMLVKASALSERE